MNEQSNCCPLPCLRQQFDMMISVKRPLMITSKGIAIVNISNYLEYHLSPRRLAAFGDFV